MPPLQVEIWNLFCRLLISIPHRIAFGWRNWTAADLSELSWRCVVPPWFQSYDDRLLKQLLGIRISQQAEHPRVWQWPTEEYSSHENHQAQKFVALMNREARLRQTKLMATGKSYSVSDDKNRPLNSVLTYEIIITQRRSVPQPSAIGAKRCCSWGRFQSWGWNDHRVCCRESRSRDLYQ